MEAIMNLQFAALVASWGASDALQIGKIWPKITKNSSSSFLLLLSRFVLTVYLITSMFPFTEGWLHAQNIGPAAQAL